MALSKNNRHKRFRNKYPKSHGFTIIELLIVMVVIGILTAITIIAFNGMQNRANIAAIKSDLKSLSQKINVFYIDNNTYPATVLQLNSLSWTASVDSYQRNSQGNLLYCAITSGSGARYTVAARTNNNTAFTYSSTDGLRPYMGTWTGAWSIDCPLYGYDTSASNFSYSQGYHPPSWGSPGWRIWTGGAI